MNPVEQVLSSSLTFLAILGLGTAFLVWADAINRRTKQQQRQRITRRKKPSNSKK